MRKTGQVITFIDTAVNAAKPLDNRRTEFRLRDTKGNAMERLVLEVLPPIQAGQKPKRVWRVHYDVQEGDKRVRRKIKIGDGQTALAQIRERWKDIKNAVDEKRDWIKEQENERRRAEHEQRTAFTFSNLASAYMTRHSKLRKRSWRDDERKLEANILPAIGGMRVQDITKSHIIRIIDKVACGAEGKGAPVQADRTKALLSSIFNWARDEDLVAHNPADRIRARSEKKRREHVYSPDEMRAIWTHLGSAAATDTAAHMGAIVRLGFLTGQRLGELVGATRQELTLGSNKPIWRIPGKRTKNNQPHIVPLSPLAAMIFARALERAGENAVFVFPSAVKQGAPLHRDTASHAFASICQRLNIRGENADFHAIRHTVRTELGRLGVARETAEMILNHKNPATSIATLYDHGDYDDQKRAALCAWEEKLRTIVDDEEERSAFREQHGAERQRLRSG